ncbi:THAP domain-containing protein 9 [Plakobranchus ocellatus]|uniref:THAP domain-containing protein 9 n=1 Tax=Plakobranchus ocellatus TaxID=259542 RepID=A0AAV4ADF9_9GAST|nr:THAP domain-containing protein 9 [Plakobranchus ocellatus]
MSRIDQFNLCQNIQKFDEFVTTKKNLQMFLVNPLSVEDGRHHLLDFSSQPCLYVQYAKTCCKEKSHRLHYVLTVRFSQDHLERLFSRIHRKGGWNNNSNILQLKWSLRALLLHNGVTASARSNCVEADDNPPVICKTPPLSKDAIELTTGYFELILQPSAFHNKALYYIAGYICRMICALIKRTP